MLLTSLVSRGLFRSHWLSLPLPLIGLPSRSGHCLGFPRALGTVVIPNGLAGLTGSVEKPEPPARRQVAPAEIRAESFGRVYDEQEGEVERGLPAIGDVTLWDQRATGTGTD